MSNFPWTPLLVMSGLAFHVAALAQELKRADDFIGREKIVAAGKVIAAFSSEWKVIDHESLRLGHEGKVAADAYVLAARKTYVLALSVTTVTDSKRNSWRAKILDAYVIPFQPGRDLGGKAGIRMRSDDMTSECKSAQFDGTILAIGADQKVVSDRHGCWATPRRIRAAFAVVADGEAFQLRSIPASGVTCRISTLCERE